MVQPVRKLLTLIIKNLFKEEFSNINARLVSIEDRLTKLESSTQIDDMSKAIKGIYDLLCGVIQIGSKK